MNEHTLESPQLQSTIHPRWGEKIQRKTETTVRNKQYIFDNWHALTFIRCKKTHHLYTVKMSVDFTNTEGLFENQINCDIGLVGWLFWFNSLLRQYFNLYLTVSQREGERVDESKNVQTIPTRTYCKCSRPLPYCKPNGRTGPGTGSLPSTIALSDHPRDIGIYL